MATETQKNYKKQIKKLQKELDNRNDKDDGYYSYIERDYIKSYYQKRKRKRRIIISSSVIGLLILLWNSYAIYTWVNPVYYSLTGKVLPTIGRVLDVKSERNREVAEYLDKVNINNSLEKRNLNYRTSNLIAALEGKIDKTEYFDKMEEFSDQIKQDISRIESVDIPGVMKDYHGIVLERLRICSAIYERTIEIKNIRDVDHINKCLKDINTLIYKYNEVGSRSRDEMINVFNDIGMEYKLENGGIRYWWNR